MKQIFLLLVFLLTAGFSAFGQTNQAFDNKLSALYDEMENYSAYGENHDLEKLDQAKSNFADALSKAAQNASTLGYAFPKLGKKITIKTSADKKFRVYSWDTLTGGTMHFFDTLHQYQTANGKVYAQFDGNEDETFSGRMVNKIFQCDTPQGKIYIVYETAIGSTIDRADSITLYKIGASKLEPAKLFQTKMNLTDSISYAYSAMSGSNPKKDSIAPRVSFDNRTKTLKFPVVVEDKNFLSGRVTNRFIAYRFNGKYFVKIS